MSVPRPAWTAWACLAVFSLNACDQVDQIQNELRDQTPHEAYVESLRAVKLAETALGTLWVNAAVRSLSDAPTVTLPFEEEGFLFAETPEARSYRVELRRGQRLSIDADVDGGDPFRIFIDVYRVPENPSNSPLPVMSSGSPSETLEYVSTRRAEYVRAAPTGTPPRRPVPHRASSGRIDRVPRGGAGHESRLELLWRLPGGWQARSSRRGHLRAPRDPCPVRDRWPGLQG